MNKKALFKFAALFLLAYTVLLVLSLQFGRQYVASLLPLYRWEIGWCAPEYRIQSLAVQENRGEAVVALNLKLEQYTFVAGQLLHPGGDITSSTLAGHSLQHVLLIFSLLAAWPAAGISRRFVLLCLVYRFYCWWKCSMCRSSCWAAMKTSYWPMLRPRQARSLSVG